MVAPSDHPSAVPMTIPSTSPIAQPVRQCSVALTARRVSAARSVAPVVPPAWSWSCVVMTASASPYCPPRYTPLGYMTQGPGGAIQAVAGRRQLGKVSGIEAQGPRREPAGGAEAERLVD